MWTLVINEAWLLSLTQFLRYPLGDWIDDTHQIHKFVYCLDTSAIFETFTNGDIHEYRKVEHKNEMLETMFFMTRFRHSLRTLFQKPFIRATAQF